MENILKSNSNPIETLINNYSMEFIILIDEMETTKSSILLGIKNGKVEAYENIIDDLELLIDNKNNIKYFNIQILLTNYLMEILRLKNEMKTTPSSIRPWGIMSGKVKVYENVIKDLIFLNIS